MGSHVGVEFKRLREGRGLSQAHVARASSGLSRTTIVNVEAGADVRLETVLMLSQALGAPRHERLALIIAWVRDCLGEEIWSELIVKPSPLREHSGKATG